MWTFDCTKYRTDKADGFESGVELVVVSSVEGNIFLAWIVAADWFTGLACSSTSGIMMTRDAGQCGNVSLGLVVVIVQYVSDNVIWKLKVKQ